MQNLINIRDIIGLVAPEPVSSGGVFVSGSIVGIATAAASAGQVVEVMVSGVFILPKVSTDVVTQGQKLYWNAALGKLTNAPASDLPLVGLAVQAAGNGTDTVEVWLGAAPETAQPSLTLTALTMADTYFDDLFFPLTASKKGANDKPDYDYTLKCLMFPQNDTSEYVDIPVQLPHRWKEGMTLRPHVHWKQRAAAVPVFKMAYKWYNPGETVPANPSIYTMDTLVFPYTSGTIHQISVGSGGISGAGKTLSSMLEVQLYREDNALTGDAAAIQFDIHIEIDTFGSREEYEK